MKKMMVLLLAASFPAATLASDFDMELYLWREQQNQYQQQMSQLQREQLRQQQEMQWQQQRQWQQ